MVKRKLLVFWCPRMTAKMTLSACVTRHKAANAKKLKPGEKAMLRATMGPCRGCDIGAEHKRGRRHPDAPDAELSPRPDGVHLPPPPPACLGCGSPFQPRHRERNCSTACRLVAARSMERMADHV